MTPFPIFAGITLKAVGGTATTILFAFPILLFLNTIQEHYLPTNPNSLSV